ncbi:MAG: exonuclease domain-containing protein [Thiomargarita sp.]|nr:exonuclease domain-containing protein [Thiomargarita sp.]
MYHQAETEKILVIDIEATCWKDEIPDGQENEIIEIGICVLDAFTCERLEKKSLIIKSTSIVSEFCTELTTLTQEIVDKGISLKEGCDILQTQYLSKERAWASYGAYDRKLFQRECHDKDITYPFNEEHINIKHRYADSASLKKKVGMAKALRQLDFPLEGIHHRGVDDAWNSANILAWILYQE